MSSSVRAFGDANIAPVTSPGIGIPDRYANAWTSVGNGPTTSAADRPIDARASLTFAPAAGDWAEVWTSMFARLTVESAATDPLAPTLDAETIRHYLDIIPKICAGEKSAGIIGKLTQRERFYWLTAQRSTIIQTSPVHTGICADARALLEHLFEKMVC